ncbi:MAG: hypothetical protein V1655_00805 [bacterium]
MRQFVIPQFIDVETKIIGPVTVRQFLIMLITFGIIFITYKLCDFSLFIVAGFTQFAIGGMLAFLKVNGRPVHYFLLNFFETARRPKLKIWYKDFNNNELRQFLNKPKEEQPALMIPQKEFIAQSRLSELSLIVDTGGAYRGE